MPQDFTYPSMDAANNVVFQLPAEARDPESGVLMFPQENGSVILRVPDEFIAFVPGTDPGTPGKPALDAYAANKRWEVESAGIIVTVDGVPRPIRTTLDSQSKIADLNTSFVNGTNTGTVSFKCADGTFFEADAAAINTIYVGVMDHLQACYTAEEQAHAGVAGGTALTTQQVDAYFAGIPTLDETPFLAVRAASKVLPP